MPDDVAYLRDHGRQFVESRRVVRRAYLGRVAESIGQGLSRVGLYAVDDLRLPRAATERSFNVANAKPLAIASQARYWGVLVTIEP